MSAAQQFEQKLKSDYEAAKPTRFSYAEFVRNQVSDLEANPHPDSWVGIHTQGSTAPHLVIHFTDGSEMMLGVSGLHVVYCSSPEP